MPLVLNGTTGVQDNSGAFVQGTAVASTSGTSIDFTSIPSWVKRITVMFNGVSQNSASQTLMFQLGDSGGIETSGYSSVTTFIAPSTAVLAVTTGLGFAQSGAAGAFSGNATIALIGSNSWTFSSTMANTVNTEIHYGAGSKTLSDILDRIRITTVGGTATFDAGTINILYE